MAHDSDLPCDGDGICMICKKKPDDGETLTCKTCVAPWHVTCLSSRPETLADAVTWECPDCSFVSGGDANATAAAVGGGSEIVAAIRAIESDGSLTEQEKAKRRQELMSGGGKGKDDEKERGEKMKGENEMLDLFDESLNCSFCMQLPERPVTTPCGHNFCLKCFEKWIGQGKRTCANCRDAIPPRMASNPRINSALVTAIRMAKMSKTNASGGPPKEYHFVHNENRPDKAYTTERAKKTGKANAASGKIFVTVPLDHFGPILAENDPERKQGVLVGETWEDRMECRQWGAHFPHVAGIAGQSEYGAQSVALSGGYEDDEDHGEWFIYTGSGGRDLSGNKRTNKMQSFDQKFDKSNEALRVSCRKGYPVRVVRSSKEKRSAYAPEEGVRYDGIYRIEKCWRKSGIQGFKVCRYLFVRCDNAPAPWTSDDNGDRPRPLPTIPELNNATDITERQGVASWDYDEEKGWIWKKPPPKSRKQFDSVHLEDGTTRVRRHRPALSIQKRLLKEFSCSICRKVMNLPLTTPCAHNFCKSCLESSFAGQTFINQRTCEGRRTLRTKKNIMKCPSCSNDVADFLQNPQVNRELMGVIESLQRQSKQTEDDGAIEETDGTDESLDVVPEDGEASEETDGTDEKLDMVPEDAELCNETSDLLKEDTEGKESNQKPPPQIQPKEQKKVSDGDCIPLEKTDAMNEEREVSGKESKESAVDTKVKRTNKRKADDSSGERVKSRNRKA